MRGAICRRIVIASAVLVLVAVLGAGAAPAPTLRLRDAMSAAEFDRCGLAKLTPAELAALEAWIHERSRSSPQPQAVAAAQAAPARAGSVVSFNRQSRKYHCPQCQAARACTVNCEPLSLAQALERGGVPCGLCGGTCR